VDDTRRKERRVEPGGATAALDQVSFFFFFSDFERTPFVGFACVSLVCVCCFVSHSQSS
jgi:hypothetical protein